MSIVYTNLLRATQVSLGTTLPRFLSSPFMIRVPFPYYSVLILEIKKGKKVVLRNLATF